MEKEQLKYQLEAMRRSWRSTALERDILQAEKLAILHELRLTKESMGAEILKYKQAIEAADQLLYCLLEDLKDKQPVITKEETINAVEEIKKALSFELDI